MDMSNVPYEDVGEDFRAAQGAIYADRMMLTPLVGDRKCWLLAAYPSELRPEVMMCSNQLKAILMTTYGQLVVG
jgi:hypothetical protein